MSKKAGHFEWERWSRWVTNFRHANSGECRFFFFDIIILFIYVINNQNTSRECGQSAAKCPGLSQSSQKIVAVLDREFIPASSLSILQLKISWPGRSHISHTWPLTLVMSELSVLLDTLLSRFLPSSESWLLLEIFLCRDVISLSRSISCSSSSFNHDFSVVNENNRNFRFTSR